MNENAKLSISRTSPFRDLQKRIGSATYRFNTILVGLELVAAGGDKSRALPVSWTKPVDPEKARQIANQAEIFACIATLALASDVFEQYVSEIAKVTWLGFSSSTTSIATKSITRSAHEGGSYSVAERAEALLQDLEMSSTPALAAVDLFSKWRNVSVHSKPREAILNSTYHRALLDSREHFKEHYSNLDIELAVKNFENRRTPVPKEITSLVAAAQNIARSIDEAAITRASSVGMISLVERMLRDYFTAEDRNRSSLGELSDALQGNHKRRKESIIKLLERVGITRTSKPVSPELSEKYIEELSSLTPKEFAKKLGL